MTAEQPRVGDKIRVSMPGGKLVEAVIRAVLDDDTDGDDTRSTSATSRPR